MRIFCLSLLFLNLILLLFAVLQKENLTLEELPASLASFFNSDSSTNCWHLGPLHSQAALDRFQKILKQQQIAHSSQSRPVWQHVVYRLYDGPYASKDEATDRLDFWQQRLPEASITILPENHFGISLGVYLTKTEALAKSRGLSVKDSLKIQREFNTLGPIHWLNANAPREDILAIAAQWSIANPAIKPQPVACDEIRPSRS